MTKQFNIELEDLKITYSDEVVPHNSGGIAFIVYRSPQFYYSFGLTNNEHKSITIKQISIRSETELWEGTKGNIKIGPESYKEIAGSINIPANLVNSPSRGTLIVKFINNDNTYEIESEIKKYKNKDA